MLKQFRVQNYKALRDVSLELTPIHVLIGPNDSGKTSILEALAALFRSTEKPLNQAFTGNWQGRSLVWQHDPDAFVALDATFDGGMQYQLNCRFDSSARQVYVQDERAIEGSNVSDFTNRIRNAQSFVSLKEEGHQIDPSLLPAARRVYDQLHGLHVCRWNTRLLSLPAAPDSSLRFRVDESGFGLALCLDDILGWDRRAFTQLEDHFRRIFPQVQSIKLKAERVAVKTFDAWMLADEKALRAVFGQVINKQPDPESIRDAKAVCRMLCAEHGCELPLTELYALIAQHADIVLLEERCPKGFGAFSKRVRGL